MITTLATLKARLGLEDADVKDDALLTQFLQYITGRFDNECNRVFGYTLNAVEEFEGDETEIRVRCFPIDEVQPITFLYRQRASDGWLTPNVSDYIVRRGCVISLVDRMADWKAQATVTYSGGYLLPDGSSPSQASVPLPADLQYAAVEQMAWMYQNRSRLGITSMTGEHGSFAQIPKLDLLPNVAQILSRYERIVA